MTSAPTVFPYSIDKLRSLLWGANGIATPQVIASKAHSVYFEEYFAHIGAKTIVVEPDYIDRGFIEDYAAYYVRCFHEYPRTCTRIHFFEQEFHEASLTGMLEGINPAFTLDQNAYLGFIVVKPLPKTVIGRTCLRTYPRGGRRFLPATRRYPVNLYGIDLEVEGTLAFQEQDTVADACATSALWSVFQGTGRLFQHQIPSPVSITETAAEHWMVQTRTLPNTAGLNAEQMAYAIRKMGLEPLFVNPTNEFLFQSTLYAYLKGGIPLLCGIVLEDHSTPTPSFVGRHAVAITGFSLGRPQPTPCGNTNLLFQSSRIDKIYVHDDQVGPFSRMVFQQGYLTTSWPAADNSIGLVRTIPEIMLIPLYHKIRIPFQSILDSILRFDAMAENLRQHTGMLQAKIEWDVYLTSVNDFKRAIIQSQLIDGSYKNDILRFSLPRYLWRATALVAGLPVIDLLIDATDIEQGDYLLLAVEYHEAFSALLQKELSDPNVAKAFADMPEWKIIQWFHGNGAPWRFGPY